MALLRAGNLKKSFRQRLVVKGVNILVQTGEIIGLLGRNGAGKTTTFQMIAGLLKPDSGSLYLDDKEISRLATHQRAEEGITYLPQENSVFLNASVEKNLRMIIELQLSGKKGQKEKTTHLLNELGLLPLAKQAAHSLSGGERRKLEICRSLALDPKFLLLDEPFTGIDPITIRELQTILLRLKNKGIGMVISDHNVRDTLQITDRTYVIDEGEILIEGTPREVAQDASARERFFGKEFRLGGEVSL